MTYAEDTNYFKTSRSGVESWMERIEREVDNAGGSFISDAFGRDSISGKAAFMIEFELSGERYRAVWPVLETYEYKTPKDHRGAEKAAKVQAITAMFHDIKNSCVKAKFLGNRQAFFDYLLLPDGRTTAQASTPELMDKVPGMLQAYNVPLIEGEIVEE